MKTVRKSQTIRANKRKAKLKAKHRRQRARDRERMQRRQEVKLDACDPHRAHRGTEPAQRARHIGKRSRRYDVATKSEPKRE